MYTIYAKKSVEKDLYNLLNQFSEDIRRRVLNFLATTPLAGKKEMQFHKYDLPNANRIIYSVLKKENKVNILCAGDHNTYERFLGKHGKKR